MFDKLQFVAGNDKLKLIRHQTRPLPAEVWFGPFPRQGIVAAQSWNQAWPRRQSVPIQSWFDSCGSFLVSRQFVVRTLC